MQGTAKKVQIKIGSIISIDKSVAIKGNSETEITYINKNIYLNMNNLNYFYHVSCFISS